jgi:uncharacterized protein with HEPN domain
MPEALKLEHPNIDWRGVTDIENVLRHAYDRVSTRKSGKR